MRIFRDQTNLAANPDLWGTIVSALDDSEFLLYLASPAAARSPWVQKELDYWLSHRDLDSLVLVVTEGVVDWDSVAGDFDWETTNVLANTLRGRFEREPLFVDVRELKDPQLPLRDSRFLDSVATVAATLHRRSKDEIFGENVRQHRRTIRLAVITSLTLLILAISASVLGVLSWRRGEIASVAKADADKAKIERELEKAQRLIEESDNESQDGNYSAARQRLFEAHDLYVRNDVSTLLARMALLDYYLSSPPAIHWYPVNSANIDEIAISPDGRQLLATTNYRSSLVVFESFSGRKIWSWKIDDEKSTARIVSAVLRSDGVHALSDTGIVLFPDASKKQSVAPDGYRIIRAVFSPDPHECHVLLGGTGTESSQLKHRVWLWNLDVNKERGAGRLAPPGTKCRDGFLGRRTLKRAVVTEPVTESGVTCD